jgi:hypothetical protein
LGPGYGKSVSGIAASPSGLVYAALGYSTGGVYVSVDSGASWQATGGGLPSPYSLAAVAVDSLGRAYASSTDHGVYVFHSAIAMWKPINSGLADSSVVSLYIDHLGHLWAGTSSGNIYRSVESALRDTSIMTYASVSLVSPMDGVLDQDTLVTLQWQGASILRYRLHVSIDRDFLNPLVLDTTITKTELSVGPLENGTRYYWRVQGTDYGLNSEVSATWSFTTFGKKPLPSRFSLLQNYPNPFNSMTTIGYQLPGPSKEGEMILRRVDLTVYDLLGRKIAVLVNEGKEPGSYEVKFDGSGLASGVYLYRMQAGSFVQTKRLLLLR